MTKESLSQLTESLFQEQQSKFPVFVEEVLEKANKQRVDGADVSIGVSTGFSITVRNGEVETIEQQWDKSASITVYKDQRCGSTTTGDVNSKSLESNLQKAMNIAKFADKDPFAGLVDKDKLAFNYPDLKLYTPWDIQPEDAIELALECERMAVVAGSDVLSSEGITVDTHQSFNIFGNTDGFVGAYPYSEHSIVCSLLAKKNGERERDMDYTVARNSVDLTDIKTLASSAAERTISRLNAQKIKTQKTPVLFVPQVARGLVGHLLSGISGSRLYRSSSFMLDKLNHQIFPDFVNIQERPLLEGALGSRPFDSEGAKVAQKHFIKGGVLETYIMGSYSARRMGMESTGNSGGTSNLLVDSTAGDFDSMIKMLDRGVVVTELLGQGVNLVNGDYSRGAAGFWVENGVIQYPIHEFTIAGNLNDMFKRLVAIGSDIDYRSSNHTGSWLIEEMDIAGK